jgi:hypothetical protein
MIVVRRTPAHPGARPGCAGMRLISGLLCHMAIGTPHAVNTYAGARKRAWVGNERRNTGLR